MTTLMLFMLFSGPAVPAQRAPSGRPVEILDRGYGADQAGREVINFSLLNHSPKEVLAYTVAVAYRNAEGEIIMTGSKRQVSARALQLGGEAHFLASSNWDDQVSEPPKATDGARLKYTVELDFVAFADGSTWGMDRLNTAPYLDGMRQGAQMAVGRLRDKLAKEGVDAVQQFLLKGPK
jgi:hypothetical protein